LRKIDIAGRGPVYENGAVITYPATQHGTDTPNGPIERDEADILHALAEALRHRESLESAITNLRVLAAEFQATAQGARLSPHGEEVLRANLERAQRNLDAELAANTKAARELAEQRTRERAERASLDEADRAAALRAASSHARRDDD